VSSRLTRARERLRERLTRRGFAPAIAATALVGDAASAVPAALLDSTISAAVPFAARLAFPGGPPPRSATIAHGVLRTMTLTKLRFAAMFVASAMLAAGAVLAGSKEAPVPDPRVANEIAPQEPSKPAVQKREKPIKTVQVVSPQPDGPNHRMVEVCRAEPMQQSRLHASAAGYLKSVKVDIGDRVKKGQILAEIDASALAVDARLAKVAIEQAQGALREAQAKVMGARAEVVAAEANLRVAETSAKSASASVNYRKKQFDRVEALAKEGAVDAKIVDEAEAQLLAATESANSRKGMVDSANAEINVKKAKLAQVEAPVVSAQLNVDAAKLNLEKAQIALEATKIVAPFDGVVTVRNCSPNDYVRPDQPALLTIVRTDAVRVVVEIPEKAIPRVEPGLAVEVVFEALPGKKFAAKVSRIGFIVKPSDRGRVMRAEVDVVNSDGSLRPGMIGMIAIRPAPSAGKSLWIPRNSRFGQIDKLRELEPGLSLSRTLFVYRNGKAKLIAVRVGLESDSLGEIEILSGLEPSDRVILWNDGESLEDGEPVRPAEPKK